jgi:hypothetical protein
MHGMKFRAVFAATMVGLALITLFPAAIGLEKIDVVTIALVLLAFLPWLSTFLSEFSAGGITVKLREIEKKIETVAEQQVRTDDQLIQSATAAQSATKPRKSAMPASQGLDELAQKYISTRNSMRSGPARTTKMTDIFVEMRAAALATGPGWDQAEGWLADDDPGRNLGALAFLNAFPEKVKPSSLIDLVERTSQPFIQYWALRTLNSFVQTQGSKDFSVADVRRLKALEGQLGPSVDRGILVRSINRDLNTGSNR